jgi:hypothetical protein
MTVLRDLADRLGVAAMAELGEGSGPIRSPRRQLRRARRRSTTSRRRLGQLFNHVAELVALGLELAGLRAPAQRRRPARMRSLRETRVMASDGRDAPQPIRRAERGRPGGRRRRQLSDRVAGATRAVTPPA